VLLTPDEPPPTDLTGDCVADAPDLLIRPGERGEGESAADFNSDGVVEIFGLLTLLAAWG